MNYKTKDKLFDYLVAILAITGTALITVGGLGLILLILRGIVKLWGIY